MAIMDCRRVPRGTTCTDCRYASVDICTSYRMATALYNAGYRKIPEDSVVITREEYESLIEQARKETARVILKQFAERLKNKFVRCVGGIYNIYHPDTIDERIDETLKEMINEKKNP